MISELQLDYSCYSLIHRTLTPIFVELLNLRQFGRDTEEAITCRLIWIVSYQL